MNSPVYKLELSRWGVFKDGTHPLETTNGINKALIWAKENGYKTFEIPDGTYLIAKGTKPDDPNARINMVSDMDLILNDNSILQKETNEFEIYSILHLGVNVKNVTVKGGVFRGDSDTHDYSKKGSDTAGTHEWGYGIQLVGAENIVIDGVRLEKFTGDGIIVTATTITGSTILEVDLEMGGIDDNGNPIPFQGKVRTNNRAVTNFDNPVYQIYRNIYFWLPQGLAPGSRVNVYYYRKDGSFIKADKDIRFFSGESVIPDDVDYFRAVFDAESPKGVKVNRMTVDISKNITIQNCDIGNNRRQGISLVGSDGVQILNNYIHHTKGTKPESGIDIEPGFYPGRNTIIKGNKFTDNQIQVVLAYGENIKIEENKFEILTTGMLGLHAHADFRGEIIVRNNTFLNSSMTVYPESTLIEKNKIIHGNVKLLGKNITFRNSLLVDTVLNIGSEEGQKISNIFIENNLLQSEILFVGVKPVNIQNLTIRGQSNGKNLINGNGNSQSVYDRFTIEDKNRKGTVLPAGTYNNSVFETGVLTINMGAKYILNSCLIKNNSNLLSINNTYGKPDVTIQQSTLELTENIGYGAAIYILGAQKFELLNCKVLAPNNTQNTPLIKIGPYGYPKSTNIFGATIKGNLIYTKTSISGLHTSNAGTDAPPYIIEDNLMINALLNLAEKDINVNNNLFSI